MPRATGLAVAKRIDDNTPERTRLPQMLAAAPERDATEEHAVLTSYLATRATAA